MFVAVGFAVESTLGRPAPLVRVAAATPAAAARTSVVWSSQVVDGRRVRSVCRSFHVGKLAESIVLLSDGNIAVTAPSGTTRLSGARASPLLELEALLAGCSADVVRMLTREIHTRFARGVPVSLTPGYRAGRPVYSIGLRRGDLFVELALDRRTLAPFALRVRDESHSGESRLHEMKKLVERLGAGGESTR